MTFLVEGKGNQHMRKSFIPFQSFGTECTWKSWTWKNSPRRTSSPTFTLTLCMVLASRPHVTQFSQLQRVNCDSYLGLSCLLPNQSLLPWEKALGPWEGQLTFQTGCAPMENGINLHPRMEYFLFLLRVPTYTLPAFCCDIPECQCLLLNLLMQVFINLSN